MAAIAGDLSRKILGHSDANKAFRPWWDNIEDNCLYAFVVIGKVEKILEGSLDSIPLPSPSFKIQITGAKVCLRCKGKTLLGVVNKLLKIKIEF